MIEEFRELKLKNDFLVKVGNNGTIIGLKGKYKPSSNNSKGYLRIHTKVGTYSVHRLVALAWIPNPNNKPQVNHKDGNKLNNIVDNLEWVTNQENRIHAVKNNLSSARLTTQQVEEIRRLYETGKYTYHQLGKMYNVSYSTIGYLIRRDSWEVVA